MVQLARVNLRLQQEPVPVLAHVGARRTHRVEEVEALVAALVGVENNHTLREGYGVRVCGGLGTLGSGASLT